MTMVGTMTLPFAGERVSALFERLFTDIEGMRRVLTDLFASGPVDSVKALAAVESDVRTLLTGGTALGGGYVAARDALTDRPLYLAWWQGDDQQLLGESDAPASGAPFDYTRREWFRVPAESGRRHVTGPYVDYVCTDEYVVTCTAPVVVDGRLTGVVGADVLVETLERTLLPELRSVGATLVGDHGRAIASADHRIAPGTLLDPDVVRGGLACGDLPLTLVITR